MNFRFLAVRNILIKDYTVVKNCYYWDYEVFQSYQEENDRSNLTRYICKNQKGYTKVLRHYEDQVGYPYHNNNYPKKYPCVVEFWKATLSFCCPMEIEYIPLTMEEYINLSEKCDEKDYITFNWKK